MRPKVPCKECPWRRDSEPGAIGTKSIPPTYIGQAYGPFRLPCHELYAEDMDRPDWKDFANKSGQCAGAAIFRANVGVSGKMPKGIHRLEPNTEIVFASAAEFLAHHGKVSLPMAEVFLEVATIDRLVWMEMNSPGMRVLEKR